MARILVVDDEVNMRRLLTGLLEDDGHDVTAAEGVHAARATFSQAPFDLVVTDQKMGDGTGLDLLASCRDLDPSVPVVFLTAYPTVDLAVEAMRGGAFDVIAKPFVPDAVRATVARACERTELLRENERLRRQVGREAAEDDLVGEGAAMGHLKELIRRVAPTNATVLITGETGSGKELVARAIHARSQRARAAFVAVNCAGLTETLLESELFGHERGAFTGADRRRIGVFEAAHRGTLFLDEAGEMSLALQAKLLRVLMNGEVIPVGATAPRTVDVRILAATNRDLAAEVRAGRFREDLYYRLAVVPVYVPPLRERREDLPALVDHFLAAVARELKAPRKTIAPAAIAALAAYEFPGNVRELRNLLERATILARGQSIGPHDLPVAGAPLGRSPRPSTTGAAEARLAAGGEVDLRELLDDTERAVISEALAAAGGVQAEAARRLSVSRSHLAYRLRRLGLAEPER